MTCPHCGASARAHERFCPACSRLIDSPLLKMQKELEAARAAMRRERPKALAQRAAQGLGIPGLPSPTPGLPPLAATTIERARQERRARKEANTARKAEIRARLAEMRSSSVAPPLPTTREVHTRAAHQAVPDRTLEEALRVQAEAAKALERARQPAAPTPPPPPRPPRPPKTKPGTTAQAPAVQPAAKPVQAEAKAGDTARGAVNRRTPALTVLLLLNLAMMYLLYEAVVALEAMPEGSLGFNAAEAARVAAYVIGGLIALATLGLWAMQPFGRALQRLVSWFWLPVFPFGTLLAFIAVLHLGSRGVRLLFSGRSGRNLSKAESELAARTRRFSPVLAVVFLLLGFVAWGELYNVGRTLAPTLREPGTVGELLEQQFGGGPSEPADPHAAMLADMEAYATAQLIYSQLNGGYYDRTECLVAGNCIPGQDSIDSPLDARFLEAERFGYRFEARLAAPPSPRPDGVSATSVGSFAYYALPGGSSTSGPGYCIGPSLDVCTFDSAAPSSWEPGECPSVCDLVARE